MSTRGPHEGEGDRSASIPLARLFAMAFRDLIEGLHDRLRDRGWRDVRPVFGFVLLALRSEPRTASDVAELMGMTKQATKKLIDAMETAGYVARRAHEGDARAKALILTRRGHRLLAEVEGIYGELEAEWADVLGPDRVAALRSDLVHVLRATHDGELPPVRPTW